MLLDARGCRVFCVRVHVCAYVCLGSWIRWLHREEMRGFVDKRGEGRVKVGGWGTVC